MTKVKGAFTELPVINIQGLNSENLAERQAVADAIGQASREVGFFYITGHGIAPELIAGVRAAAKILRFANARKNELLHWPIEKS